MHWFRVGFESHPSASVICRNHPGDAARRRWFRAGLIRCWLFLTVSLLSHSLLDSVTTGGKGVGWLWPWSDERFFAPWQAIKVAPFALSRYTTPYGHQVIISELMWVWLPGMLLMGMLWWRRR
ncbi:TPA: metal-dependent hydrolase [Escherichia coli]|nr:metal-dependent hydrolase [Escherichia coli]